MERSRLETLLLGVAHSLPGDQSGLHFAGRNDPITAEQRLVPYPPLQPRNPSKDYTMLDRTVRHEWIPDFTGKFKSVLALVQDDAYARQRIDHAENLNNIYDRLMQEAGDDQNQIEADHAMLDELVDEILNDDKLKYLLTGLYLSDENDPNRKRLIMKRRLESELGQIAGDDRIPERYLDLLRQRGYINGELQMKMKEVYDGHDLAVRATLPLRVWFPHADPEAVLQSGVRYDLDGAFQPQSWNPDLLLKWAENERIEELLPFFRGSFLDGYQDGKSLHPLIMEIIRVRVENERSLDQLVLVPNVATHLRRHTDEFKAALGEIVNDESERDRIFALLASDEGHI